MSSLEAALAHYLRTRPDISARAADRVYPKLLPQDPTYPAVLYHRVATNRHHNQAGSSRLANPQFQIDVFALTLEEAIALADAVYRALDGHSGLIGEAPNQVDVHGCFVEEQEDGYDEDLRLFWHSITIMLWHNE